MMKTATLGGAVLLASTIVWASPIAAQDYPSRPIHVICAYPAGTGADIMIRYLAEGMRVVADVPVVVDNKPGALTTLGADYVAKSRPDGYTLFITAGNSSFSAAVHAFKTLPYDPVNDFTPVTALLRLPFILTVDPRKPVRSVAELTSYLKAKGDKASFGYSSPFGLAASELYNSMAGLSAVRVPYKAMPDSLKDTMSGDLDFQFIDSAGAIPYGREGRLRMLAVTSLERLKAVPDVPTMNEAGVAGYDLKAFMGAWLPAGPSAPILRKITGWLEAVRDRPETEKFLSENAGADIWRGDAAELARTTVTETKKWGELYKLANIEPQ